MMEDHLPSPRKAQHGSVEARRRELLHRAKRAHAEQRARRLTQSELPQR